MTPQVVDTDERGAAVKWSYSADCKNKEPGWEDTSTGVPKELYQFWHKSLRPRGYKLRAQIVDSPGGLAGDVSMTLKWG